MATKTPKAAATPAKRGPGRPRKNPVAAAAVPATGKQKTPVQARYEAAGMGRRISSWTPPSAGPNRALQYGQQRLLDRVHDSARNDWASESGIQKWATTLVGIAITPRLTNKVKDETKRDFYNDMWNEFVANSDADCVLDFYGQETLAVRSWAESGEVFGRCRWRSPVYGLKVPMQVQLIESEFLPYMDTDQWPGMPAGNRMRSGIEFNRIGRRIAYWFYKEHPHDNKTVTVGHNDLVRVMADEVLHMFEPKRPGQIRGVSQLAPILIRLRNILDFDDATLDRQKLANMFVAFIKTTLPQAPVGNIDPDSGQPIRTGTQGEPYVPLSPGLVQELDHGQEVQFSNPPEAGTEYSEYMRTQQLGTSAGMGIPYELFSGDIKEVSDRTLRVIINEFRRLAEQRQWQMVIPMLCQRVRNWWADAMVIAGHCPLSERDLIAKVTWAPHGWEYIHPVQDPQGKKLEIEAGIKSRSSIISENGDDPIEVDRERAEDMQREKDLDLWVDPNPAAPELGDADGIDNEEYSAPPNPANAKLAERYAKEIELMDARLEQMKRCPQADPLTDRHVALADSILNTLNTPVQ